ncbi:hypothetical protein L3Y34_003762 [Caenorhabditis briggsae]|nr:hypothetical protein L3Y34_003762 [Caenorhabditis briggsae]
MVFDSIFYSDSTVQFDSVENLKNIVKSETTLVRPLQRELRLTFQVSLPFGAQLVLLCFMIFANLYAKTGNTEMMVYVRDFFPLANGFLSFISPFTIILFNRDLTKRIRKFACGRSVKDQSEISAKISVVSIKMR